MRVASTAKLPFLAATLALLAGCGQAAPTAGSALADMFPDAGDVVHRPGSGITRFVTHNVIYRLDANMVTSMPDLDADMLVHQPGMPLIPGNIHDFDIQIHTGTIVKDQESMAHLFNDYVFHYDGCPITDVRIECHPGSLKMSGHLKQGPLSLPFSMEGNVRPDGMGHMLMHADTITSVGVPVSGGLMGLTGAPQTINAHPEHGVKMDGSDTTLDVGKMLPPPNIHGFVAGVEVLEGKVVMHFDDGVHRPPVRLPEPGARNWIMMEGGDVMINRTLLKDARLQEVDLNPEDPMYYYLPTYLDQLQAGFVVQARDSALIAYVPDVHGTTVEQGRFRPPGILASGP